MTSSLRYRPSGYLSALALRPYEPEDAKAITPRADFEAEHAGLGYPLFHAVGRPDGPCWTLVDGDAPVAVGGLEPLGYGRWAAWLYASDLSPRGWAHVARALRAAKLTHPVRRLEATVRAPGGAGDWPLALNACAFAERLGLTREGLMKAYGPDGADYWLFGGGL